MRGVASEVQGGTKTTSLRGTATEVQDGTRTDSLRGVAAGVFRVASMGVQEGADTVVPLGMATGV